MAKRTATETPAGGVVATLAAIGAILVLSATSSMLFDAFGLPLNDWIHLGIGILLLFVGATAWYALQSR